MNISHRILCFFIMLGSAALAAHKQIVVVIPSYNNAQWCEKNLISVLDQTYSDFSVIYIDDCSTDATVALVEEIIKQHPQGHRVRLVKNSKRCGAMANLYTAIHSCPDESVIVTVDGDDWLAHENVLSIIDQKYKDPNVWLTWGNFIRWPMNQESFCDSIPKNIIDTNGYREFPWVTSHLRTFYAGLFKKIKKEDLMHKHSFLTVTWDLAMMFPMLEMAAGRFSFIPDILYVYNYGTPNNDMKLHYKKVKKMDRFIRSKKKYMRINHFKE